MARHGENVRKRNDGRWEGRYKTYSQEKKKYIYRSVYGNSYEEAKKKLDEAKMLMKGAMDKQTSGLEKNTEMRFGTAVEEWLMEILRKRKHSTWIKYKTIYEKYLFDTIGEYCITELTTELVCQCIPVDLSDSIYKSIYCVINQTLVFAEERYCIHTHNIRKQERKEKRKRVEIFDRREQEKLFSILCRDIDAHKMAVLLCINTGIRLGEICSLKWNDVDIYNGIITVNRTVQRIRINDTEQKTVLLETPPKSECSRREIPVSKKMLSLLLGFKTESEYIFGMDRPMEPRTLQYRFQKYLQEARLPNKNFHVLRHTFATNCIESGMDVKSLSEILGHSSVQITLNRYVHPSIDTKRRYMEGLAGIYGQILGHKVNDL